MRRRFHYVPGGLIILLTACLVAEPSLPLGELSSTRYMEHVSFLASDALKGRGDGSPELEQAADYIAEKFKSFGLQPAGDRGTYFQSFEMSVGVEFGPENSLQIAGVSKQKDRDFVTMPISSSDTYQGPVVFAGYGISSETLNWDDYAGLDVAGKAVVVFRHDPEESSADDRFAKDPQAPTTFLNKARTARQHGAKAILFVTDPNNHPSAPDTVGEATGDLDFRDLSIVAMHVTRDAIRPLFQANGKDMARVQREIDESRRPASFAFSPNLRVTIAGDVRPIRKTVRNVLASVPGSDPNLRDQWLVIGAHYDHLGLGDSHNSMSPSDVGKIHHGADDNASGTAGVLELARLLGRHRDQFKRSVLFITFAGEELGLFGSSHFVNNPTMPLSSLTAMINMDMIGRLQGRSLNVMGTGSASEFPIWVEEANKDLDVKVTLSNSSHDGSDHLSFNGKKIPNLFFFSGLHSDYHRPTDTADKIDSIGAIQVLSLVAGVAERIANAPSKLVYTAVEDTRPATTGSGGAYSTYFGSVPDFRDDLNGVLFADVHADSPAGKAGLKAGDLLVEFGGEPVKNLYDFTDALGNKKPGDTVSVVVKRNSETIRVNVTLEVRR